MKVRTIEERLLTVKCEHRDVCPDSLLDKCLECANNKDEGESYFVDKQTYAWYKKIRGEKLD